jgi:hypothetical protein
MPNSGTLEIEVVCRSSERRDVLVVGVFDNHDEKGFWGSALEKRIKMNSKMPTIAKNTTHAVREE